MQLEIKKTYSTCTIIFTIKFLLKSSFIKHQLRATQTIMRGRKSRTYHCCSAASSPTHVLFPLRRSIVSVPPFLLFLSRILTKMIDIIQWRVSIGLWNRCQSTDGPTRRGCHPIKTGSPIPGKKKTRSLVLSLITVLLFVLTLISGYLELNYNPSLRGTNKRYFCISACLEEWFHSAFPLCLPYSTYTFWI